MSGPCTCVTIFALGPSPMNAARETGRPSGRAPPRPGAPRRPPPTQMRRRREMQQRIADARQAAEKPGIEDPILEAVGGEAEVAARAGPRNHHPRQSTAALERVAAHQTPARGEQRFAAAHVAAADVVRLVRRDVGGRPERGLELLEQPRIHGVGRGPRPSRARCPVPRGTRRSSSRPERAGPRPAHPGSASSPALRGIAMPLIPITAGRGQTEPTIARGIVQNG